MKPPTKFELMRNNRHSAEFRADMRNRGCDSLTSYKAAIKASFPPLQDPGPPFPAMEIGVGNPQLVRGDSILKLDLPTTICNALRHAGIKTVWDLVQASESSLLSISGIGRKSLLKVHSALAAHGLIIGVGA